MKGYKNSRYSTLNLAIPKGKGFKIGDNIDIYISKNLSPGCAKVGIKIIAPRDVKIDRLDISQEELCQKLQ